MDPSLTDALNSESFSSYAPDPYSTDPLATLPSNPTVYDTSGGLLTGSDNATLDASNSLDAAGQAATTDWYGQALDNGTSNPSTSDTSFWSTLGNIAAGLGKATLGALGLANSAAGPQATPGSTVLGALGFSDPSTGQLTPTGKVLLIGGVGLVLFTALRKGA